jgi:lipid-binding SYLF domain-containing protein
MKGDKDMNKRIRFGQVFFILTVAATIITAQHQAIARDLAGIDADAQAALASLYKTTPEARILEKEAKAILVFPDIVKAGFVVGAQYGEGALFQNGKIIGHYNIAAASYGLQAGMQSFGYAMFFMTDSALQSLNESAGFEVGVGPSLVVVDKGMAKSLTTTTVRKDVYAFIFRQKGLMAGAGLQGSKISRISP